MSSSTATSAIINLLNTVVGSGMLAMPFGIKEIAVIPGCFVIILCAFTSLSGLYLQNLSSHYVSEGHASFFALSQITYPSLSVLFDLAIAVKCFGVGISYLVVIGDLMPKIVESLSSSAEITHEWLLERNFWITIFMAVIIVPLSFLRRLDSLKYASMVALSSVAYLVILVFVHFFKNDIDIGKGEIRYWEPTSFTSVISAFPIFVFAYTCHQNMFSLINELADKSASNVNKVIYSAIGMAMCLYIGVGVSGYLTFGDNVSGNIIAMYPHTTSSTIGRIAIVILVMLSYPLQCHPCRASVNHVIHFIKHRKEQERFNKKKLQRFVERLESDTSTATNFTTTSSERQSLLNWQADNVVEEGGIFYPATHASGTATPVPEPQQQQQQQQQLAVPLETRKFVILTCCILILSYLVAITVTSLEKVLGFVGSTGSTSISFILPGIFAYKLIGSDNDEEDCLTLRQKFLKYGALALSCWGVIVMVVSLSANIFLGGSGH